MNVKFELSRNDKITISRMSKEDRRHYLNMLMESESFASETKNRRGRPIGVDTTEEIA